MCSPDVLLKRIASHSGGQHAHVIWANVKSCDGDAVFLGEREDAPDLGVSDEFAGWHHSASLARRAAMQIASAGVAP